MMALVPAIGATSEDLLQDTLKSMVVAFFVLTACWLHLWQVRRQSLVINLHGVLLFPILLTVYAFSSIFWSHAYLGGVETIRWFLFCLIVLLGMRSITPARLTWVAWGIHLGAVTASLWTALQFWFDFHFFAQGPNPASTFVNRNFFAEFVVCTLPFSVMLLTRLKDKTSVFAVVVALGFNVTALMMTGTRSALLALWVLSPMLLGIVWFVRKQFASIGWRPIHVVCLAATIIATVLCFGSIETRNARLLSESTKTTAISRAFDRTLSLTERGEYAKGSFSMRRDMWAATGRMVKDNPFSGVGAGAWEVQIPRYQLAGSQLEIDYYAHNEPLQLVAEYGAVGWVALIGLIAYLTWAAHCTYTNTSDAGREEAPLRALTLASLFALLFVSNAGFPWRLATTGALFALNLSILAASDIRLTASAPKVWIRIAWRPTLSLLSLVFVTMGALLAIYIAIQAVTCEKKIMQAIKTGLLISRSGHPQDSRWDPAKTEMLTLVRGGIAINPHYRKLTPMVADSLAGWGDWKNAIWIWESVLQSRPNIVIVMTNVARGYLQLGNHQKAKEYLERAKRIQPSAIAVNSLEVTFLEQTGRSGEAAQRAQDLLKAGVVDRELVQTAYDLGIRLHRPEVAILAMETGIRVWPTRAVDGWLKLGDIYASPDSRDDRKAIESYRRALATSSPAYRASVLAEIPQQYRSEFQQRHP
ncbi:O-antigen ligase family protein [Candidatus Aalborgicola defluviihabitans]|uniref:O-antigen ligase family protein n=1 Tax=Candidatus Aalborgicola defluviihabitans TaxID=3386187 RepID=UPI00390943FE|nr:O-antigen ligase family protein [Burkholderiales bacterium]